MDRKLGRLVFATSGVKTVAILLLMACGSALAQDRPTLSFSTAQLYEFCKYADNYVDGRPMPEEMIYCVSYLAGFGGRNALITTKDGIKSRVYCPPANGGDWIQLARVFTKWARDHPEQQHLPGYVGVANALAPAFPCK